MTNATKKSEKAALIQIFEEKTEVLADLVRMQKMDGGSYQVLDKLWLKYLQDVLGKNQRATVIESSPRIQNVRAQYFTCGYNQKGNQNNFIYSFVQCSVFSLYLYLLYSKLVL